MFFLDFSLCFFICIHDTFHDPLYVFTTLFTMQAVPIAFPSANIFTCARHIIAYAPKVQGVRDVGTCTAIFWRLVKSTTHAQFIAQQRALKKRSPTFHDYCESRGWESFVWFYQFQVCKTLGICTSNPVEQINKRMKDFGARSGTYYPPEQDYGGKVRCGGPYC